MAIGGGGLIELGIHGRETGGGGSVAFALGVVPADIDTALLPSAVGVDATTDGSGGCRPQDNWDCKFQPP